MFSENLQLGILLQSVVSGLLMGGVYALIGVGLNIIFGVMKIINFAHGALMMLGMYATYFLFTYLRIDPYLSILITTPLIFVIGLIIQRVLIRKIMGAPEQNQLLATLGIMLFLENLALFLWGPDYRTVKVDYIGAMIAFLGLRISLLKLIAFLGGLLMASALYVFLKNTYMGKAIRASSEEQEGASVVGISVNKINLISFGIGTACVGAAGALITPFFYVSPDVGRLFLLRSFMIVVMGGMGTFIGPIVGGFLLGLAEAVGAIVLPGSLGQLVPFSLFIIVLLFRPSGLFR
jgi:branched-chain amino acid transport system permease protein